MIELSPEITQSKSCRQGVEYDLCRSRGPHIAHSPGLLSLQAEAQCSELANESRKTLSELEHAKQQLQEENKQTQVLCGAMGQPGAWRKYPRKKSCCQLGKVPRMCLPKVKVNLLIYISLPCLDIVLIFS